MRKNKSIPERNPIGSLQGTEQVVIVSDPLGSYTGISQDPLEAPVQDADDL